MLQDCGHSLIHTDQWIWRLPRSLGYLRCWHLTCHTVEDLIKCTVLSSFSVPFFQLGGGGILFVCLFPHAGVALVDQKIIIITDHFHTVQFCTPKLTHYTLYAFLCAILLSKVD